MNAAEYKATRERLGMTQAALAVALGVSRKAINEREAGGAITREAAMALELLTLRTTPKRRKGTNAEPCHGANQKHHTMKPDTHEEPQTAVGSGDLLCDGSGSVCRECSGTGWLVRNLRCGDVERYPCDCPISGRIRIPSNGTRSHSSMICGDPAALSPENTDLQINSKAKSAHD